MVYTEYNEVLSEQLSSGRRRMLIYIWVQRSNIGGKEGKKTQRKAQQCEHTHTLWYSRFPWVSFLVVVFCVDSVKPCVISLACQSQASEDRSNKPILVWATAPPGPATVAVWPMTSSPRHSGRVIQEKGLETVCQRGKVSEKRQFSLMVKWCATARIKRSDTFMNRPDSIGSK